MSFKNIPGFENRYKINKSGIIQNKHDKIMSSFLIMMDMKGLV